MLIPSLFYIILFFFGAVMGSFGGVILERGQEHGFGWNLWGKVFGGRSYCPGCGETLTSRQLIPLIGWLLQKGKCFRCKSQIPVWYCIQEICMGLIFVGIGYVVLGGPSGLFSLDSQMLIELGFCLITGWALVCIILADWLWQELNVYMWTILLVFLIGFQATGLVGNFSGAFWGAVILVMLFSAIYHGAKWYATKKFGEPTEGFGEGDVMMAMCIGLLSPFVIDRLEVFQWIDGVQLVLIYLILSCVIGLLYRGMQSLITGARRDRLPFLPAMILAWMVLLWKGSVILGVMM